ncbi:hypothetical protein CRG98_019385 [Punica granatum]|uniref:Uncharacterized protein n=1 Tax=Punica granatum TaxID=22663 RepID=A0A2I0JV47_PUNGR|nr:hypothetical protein CRG98_019385 [Punica granatum]
MGRRLKQEELQLQLQTSTRMNDTYREGRERKGQGQSSVNCQVQSYRMGELSLATYPPVEVVGGATELPSLCYSH